MTTIMNVTKFKIWSVFEINSWTDFSSLVREDMRKKQKTLTFAKVGGATTPPFFSFIKKNNQIYIDHNF